MSYCHLKIISFSFSKFHKKLLWREHRILSPTMYPHISTDKFIDSSFHTDDVLHTEIHAKQIHSIFRYNEQNYITCYTVYSQKADRIVWIIELFINWFMTRSKSSYWIWPSLLISYKYVFLIINLGVQVLFFSKLDKKHKFSHWTTVINRKKFTIYPRQNHTLLFLFSFQSSLKYTNLMYLVC